MNLTVQSLKDEFLGRICMTDSDERCLLNQRLARISPSVTLNPRYALYVLKSPVFRRYVNGLNTGSLVQHMFTSQLESWAIPVPPLVRQQEIAAQLDGVTRQIEKVASTIEQQLDAINRLPAALLRRAFNGEL